MPDSLASLRNRLKLRQLVLMAALGETGSLHKASERVGMSQPSATRLLHELEVLMGGSLFERTNRGMVPNDMGRALIRRAAVILAGIEQVYEETVAIREGSAGSLRIGLVPTTPARLVSEAVSALKAETPQLEIQLVVSANASLIAGVREGSLSLAVGRAPADDTVGKVSFEWLYNEQFSVVCGPRHPLARKRQPYTLDSLVDWPWILPLPDTVVRKSIDVLFLSKAGRLPTDLVESASIASNVRMLADSERVAIMPRLVAREHMANGLLRQLVEAVPNLTGPIGMMTPSGEPVPRHVQRLVEALRTASQALQAA
jgi:DNA-binding transcriptional LysR family regulator